MRRRAFLGGLLGLAASAAQAQVFPGRLPGARAGFRFLGVADDPDVAAYKAAAGGAFSAAESSLLNTLVTGFKSDGTWALLDRVMVAGETQQAGSRDLRNPTKVYIPNGTITYTANRGWQGDGSTGYLDIGEVYNAAGNQYSLNSGTGGVFCNLDSGAAGNQSHFGSLANNPRTGISARNTTGNEVFQANDSTSDNFMASNGSRVGHRAYSRTGVATKRGFYNGSRVADLTTASTAINTTNGCILRSNTTGFSSDRISAFYSGAGMSDAQIAAMHNRLSTYLSGKGAA